MIQHVRPSGTPGPGGFRHSEARRLRKEYGRSDPRRRTWLALSEPPRRPPLSARVSEADEQVRPDRAAARAPGGWSACTSRPASGPGRRPRVSERSSNPSRRASGRLFLAASPAFSATHARPNSTARRLCVMGRRRLHHATTASIDDDLLIAVKEIARSEANQRRCVGPVATIAAPRCARQSGRRIGFRPFSERGGVVINELRPRERSGDRRRRDSCVVHNALKYNCISGTRNFLSSGTENCEFATPRKPFSRIPTQAAPPPHVRVTPGPSLPRDTGATVHFCFAVARLRDPCRRAERTAGHRPGSGR